MFNIQPIFLKLCIWNYFQIETYRREKVKKIEKYSSMIKDEERYSLINTFLTF